MNLLRVVVGSRAWGTDVAESDTDYMEVYLPTLGQVLGFETMETEHHDQIAPYYFHEFVKMLSKCNPNVLPVLGLRAEHKLFVHPEILWMFHHTDAFLSKSLVRNAFKGYALGQLDESFGQTKKNSGDLGAKRKAQLERYGYVPKSAAHALRLARMGTELLATGQINSYRELDREELMEIRSGEWTVDQLRYSVTHALDELESAAKTSRLADEPDMERIEQFTTRTFERLWNHERNVCN